MTNQAQDIYTRIAAQEGRAPCQEQSDIMDDITSLSTVERRSVINELVLSGIDTYPRNLAYNYQTQEWV